MRALITLALAAFVAAGAQAFEIQKGNAAQRFRLDGGVPLVEIGTTAYAIVEVPAGALKLELVRTLEQHKQFEGKLDMGEPMSETEIQKILEIYFLNTAFDFDSIKLRELKTSEPVYAIWCGEWFFVCIEGRGAAGNLIQFESNGKNRQGGMTGFMRQTLLIRKRSGAASPVLQSAPSPASAP